MPTTFSYDHAVNLTNTVPHTLEQGHEEEIAYTSDWSDNSYDHRGCMVSKRITENDGHDTLVKSVSYIWDNWNIIRENTTEPPAFQLSNLQTFKPSTDYVWGLDLDGSLQGAGGVGGLLAVVRDDGTYLPTYDANGNVSEYIDASDGTIVAHYDYSPFGEILMQDGDQAGTFTHRFSTKPYCPITKLVEYQLRKYKPEIGRWISRDPIEERGGFHIFCILQNDLLNMYDVFGMSAFRRRRDGHLGNLAGAYRFIWHFYTGCNAQVDIGEWGYLEYYRKAKDVIIFECEVRNKVRESVTDCCAIDGTTWVGEYHRLVDGTDGLFVMRHGMPYAAWECKMEKGKVICAINYSIIDSFEDPVDLESAVNRRLPDKFPKIPTWIVNLGGSPYPLVAKWEDTINGCTEKEVCDGNGGGSRRRRRRYYRRRDIRSLGE